MTRSRRKILFADAHLMFSEPNGLFIARFFKVLPPITDLANIEQAVESGRPDVLIVGIMFGRRNSLDHLSTWTRRFPATQVIIASGYTGSALVERAFSGGARGFVHKEDGLARLLDAIRTVLHGGVYLPSGLVVAAHPDCCRLQAPLSARESEVLSQLHSGMTYSEAGAALHISDRTIEKHARAIRVKLGIERAAQRIPWTKLRIGSA